MTSKTALGYDIPRHLRLRDSEEIAYRKEAVGIPGKVPNAPRISRISRFGADVKKWDSWFLYSAPEAWTMSLRRERKAAALLIL